MCFETHGTARHGLRRIRLKMREKQFEYRINVPITEKGWGLNIYGTGLNI